MSDLVSEVSGLIKSDYYHVGGDEVSSRQWDISPSAHRYEEDNHFASPRQIAGTFTQKAIEAANRLGRSGIVWDEALSTGIPLPQRSVVMIWRDWDNVPSKLSVASQRGLSVVMCPHSRTYLDFAQGPTDPYESQQGVVDLKKVYELPLDGHGAKVLGGQGQLWSEYIRHGPPLSVAFGDLVSHHVMFLIMSLNAASRGLDDLDFKDRHPCSRRAALMVAVASQLSLSRHGPAELRSPKPRGVTSAVQVSMTSRGTRGGPKPEASSA